MGDPNSTRTRAEPSRGKRGLSEGQRVGWPAPASEGGQGGSNSATAWRRAALQEPVRVRRWEAGGWGSVPSSEERAGHRPPELLSKPFVFVLLTGEGSFLLHFTGEDVGDLLTVIPSPKAPSTGTPLTGIFPVGSSRHAGLGPAPGTRAEAAGPAGIPGQPSSTSLPARTPGAFPHWAHPPGGGSDPRQGPVQREDRAPATSDVRLLPCRRVAAVQGPRAGRPMARLCHRRRKSVSVAGVTPGPPGAVLEQALGDLEEGRVSGGRQFGW